MHKRVPVLVSRQIRVGQQQAVDKAASGQNANNSLLTKIQFWLSADSSALTTPKADSKPADIVFRGRNLPAKSTG